MNNITEKNVREFIEAINRDALDEVRRLERESDEYNRIELEKTQDEAKKVLEERNRVDRAKIKAETNREISRLQFENKKKIIDRRTEIEDKVFKEAEDKLTEFAKSDKYLDFLIKSAQNILKEIGKENVTFFMRESDLSFKEKISEELKAEYEFKPDSTILIGGLKAESKNILADDTLDKRLQNEREWFRMNSSLSVRGEQNG